MMKIPIVAPPFAISIFETIFGEYPKIIGSLFGDIIVNLNTFFLTILGMIYAYQIIFSLTSILTKSKKFPDSKKQSSYIFLTSARNEEKVITQLIESIRALDYPQDKIDIHVIADNCNDQTAAIAKKMGAKVFIREDKRKIGKSYALNYYFKDAKKPKLPRDFAGFIIIDTDNVLDRNYLTEMNKAVQTGKSDIIAAYRNSTNMGQSLWTFGTGYSFLRECSLLHKTRENFGLASYVSGTSFFVSQKKVSSLDGWPYHRLIEDIEFSAHHVQQGGNIQYVHDAIFYDEQPNSFADSWRQRMRWVKGLFQVSRGYSIPLFKSIFARKRTLKQRISSFEAFVFVTPFPSITLYWLTLYGVLSLINLAVTGNVTFFIQTYLFTLFDFMFSLFVFTTVMSLLITFSNWQRIKISPIKKLGYSFIAFIFLLTYIPMLMIAPFLKIEWKPVEHHGLKTPL